MQDSTAGTHSGTGRLVSPIGAAEFKARCLQIVDLVCETGAEVTVTKHGRPAVKLVPLPVQSTRPPLIGSCKDSLIIADENDVVPSTEDEWAEWDAEVDHWPDSRRI